MKGQKAAGFHSAGYEFVCGDKYRDEANRVRNEVSELLRDTSGLPKRPQISDFYLYEKLWNNG